jgi:hypothetical protein
LPTLKNGGNGEQLPDNSDTDTPKDTSDMLDIDWDGKQQLPMITVSP